MLKGWVRAVVFASILAATLPAAAKVTSLVVDADTGEVLSAHDPDQQNYPASLTKMMTLYLAFEALEAGRLRLDQKLSVSAHAAAQAPSKLAVPTGGSIAVEDAIRGLAVKSANDAAVVVAEALGGTEPRFAQIMTAKAHSLGMAHTQFRNASGLPNRGQITTARDMVTLALALRRDFPKYYRYFSQQEFTYRGTTHRNHNHMLGKVDGVDGVKTGFIRASGFNIAVSAQRGARRLVAVVLGGMSAAARDAHTAGLLDQGFAIAAAKPVGASQRLRAAAAERLPAAPTRQPGLKMGALAAPLPPPDPDLAAVKLVDPATLKRGTGWAVQVGAFARPGPAKLAAAKVAKRDAALKGKPISIDRAEGDDDEGELYRARILGLTQNAARQACSRLKKQKLDCLVVAPQPEQADAGAPGG